MPGGLPRASSGVHVAAGPRLIRHALAGFLGAMLLCGARLLEAADLPTSGVGLPASTARQLDEMRRLTGCVATSTEDAGLELGFRGRPSIEIKGRQRGGDAPGAIRDLAFVDRALGRIVSYACIANASTRKSGEAIFSMAEASSRGDRLIRALLPGTSLELESVRRLRASGGESVYYEARYASAADKILFLDPPVSLLINATTGSFYRLTIDADWLDPARAPRSAISRKAAEKIAEVVLRERDLAAVFGAGAVFGKVVMTEMYMVHPNDWLGFAVDEVNAQARAAWVVHFRVKGGAAAGLQQLFVDAATGRVIGGAPGQPAEPPAR